jgi:hypothetical protein
LDARPWRDWATAPAKRVALIGTGWYGKSDILRLAQVAPIEVVGLCDADRNLLTNAESLIRTRVHPQKVGLRWLQKTFSWYKARYHLISARSLARTLQSRVWRLTCYLQKPISVDDGRRSDSGNGTGFW